MGILNWLKNFMGILNWFKKKKISVKILITPLTKADYLYMIELLLNNDFVYSYNHSYNPSNPSKSKIDLVIRSTTEDKVNWFIEKCKNHRELNVNVIWFKNIDPNSTRKINLKLGDQ